MKNNFRALLFFAFCLPTCVVSAQTSDALLNKLIEKGILTTKEADELRQETKPTRTAKEKKTIPEWTNRLTFSGDFRLRYDAILLDAPTAIDRHRFRYRLRFGAVAELTDHFEAGLRLMSGETGKSGFISGDPISGNATFEDNGSKKFIGIDLAYLKWSSALSNDWNVTLTGGKIENPLVFSELIFDPDYTPEGFGQQIGYKINEHHSLVFHAGEFILDEASRSSHDPFLFGAQLRLESKWNSKWQSSIGVSALMISGARNLATADVPNQNEGNTRLNINSGSTNAPEFGPLAAAFNPIVVDGSLVYLCERFPLYSGPFPIRFAAEYANNPAERNHNQAFSAGVTFGKAGQKGSWDFTYKYNYLESDFWFEELVDSDTGAFYERALPQSGGMTGYAAGTNVKGHFWQANYSPYDSLTFSATFYLFDLIQGRSSHSETKRLIIDASLKF